MDNQDNKNKDNNPFSKYSLEFVESYFTGQEHFNRQEYAQALEIFKESIKDKKEGYADLISASLMIGRIYFQQKKLDQAVETLQTIIKNKQGTQDCHFWLGNKAQLFVLSIFFLGQTYQAKQDLAQAKEQFELGIKINDELLNQKPLPKQDLDKSCYEALCINIKTKFEQSSLILKALLYYSQKKYTEASVYRAQAGNLLYQKGDLQGAIEEYVKAQILCPPKREEYQKIIGQLENQIKENLGQSGVKVLQKSQ